MSDEQKKTWGNTAMWVGVLTLLGTVIDQLGDAPSWAALVNTPKAFAHFAAPLIGSVIAILGAYHGGSTKSNGEVIQKFAGTASIVLALLFVGSPVSAQTIPGCHDGKLTDPRAYVESLEVGYSPAQWPAAMAAMKPKLVTYGIDVQHGTGGNVRPRVFLPTHTPPFVPDGDFGHTIDLIKTDDNGNPIAWQWFDYGGGYVAYACGSAPPPPPPPPPATDWTPRVEALERDLATLRDAQTAQAGRLTVLESRKIPTGCSASVFGFGASCKLIVP